MTKPSKWPGFSFGFGAMLGVMLAFLFYAGLRPRIEKAVEAVELAAREKYRADSTAAAKAKFRTDSIAQRGQQSPAREPKGDMVSGQLPTLPAPARSDNLDTIPRRPTLLQPAPTSSQGLSRSTAGYGLLVLGLAAVGISVRTWRRRLRLPHPAVAESKVLEALLKLREHQQLQQHLGLMPRQIKRFNSKARVQHSQLKALAHSSQQQAWRKTQNGAGTPPHQILNRMDNQAQERDAVAEFAFPITAQLQAFQLLLLLEENRRLGTSFLQADRVEFIQQLRRAYAQHVALTEARKAAARDETIRAAAGEAIFADFVGLNRSVSPRLLEQIYEMNKGLLV